jgi:AcrR family transcriptional regulator
MPKANLTKAEKKENILRHSLNLFAKNGYEATTIRMIAKESGISLGLLYNYFDGKPDVLKTIYEGELGRIMKAFSIPDDGTVVEEKFDIMVEQIFDEIQSNQLFYRLFYSLRLQPTAQKLISRQLSSLNRFIRQNLEGILIELGYDNFEQEAWNLHALVDGTAYHFLLQPRLYPLEESKSAIVKRYCVKLRAKKYKKLKRKVGVNGKAKSIKSQQSVV